MDLDFPGKARVSPIAQSSLVPDIEKMDAAEIVP